MTMENETPVFVTETLMRNKRVLFRGNFGTVNGVWDHGPANAEQWEIRYDCGNKVLLNRHQLLDALADYRNRR